MKGILQNKAECLRCGDIVESTHRHDFKRCECGSIAVDGGRDYLKRAGGADAYNDLSVYADYNDIDGDIYDGYTFCLASHNGNEELALAETADVFGEDEEYIQEIVDKFSVK